VAAGPNLLPRDGEAVLHETWVPPSEADDLMKALIGAVDWQQEHARFGAKTVPLPRLTAWYGDVGYRYSGVVHPPRPWLDLLADLRGRLPPPGGVSASSPGWRPNSVLVNFYRDGRDSMGWHSDDEAVLGSLPTIWSISLGATRLFLFRHRQTAERVGVDLGHGSLLVMAGDCQRCWQHALPKTSQPVGPRLNLTFRLTGAARADAGVR